MRGMRTSLRTFGVKRFVIESFPPSCLVDIVPSAELVTTAPWDTVDSIMGRTAGDLVLDRGAVTIRGSVQERPSRHEQGAASTKGGLAP